MAKNSKDEVSFSKKEVKKILAEAEDLMGIFLDTFEMDVEVDYQMESYVDEAGVEKHYLKVEVSGEDLGVMIGYRGRNLRSLQRVFGMILNKRLNELWGEDKFIRAVVDVAGYRENREESLQDMAERIRREVLDSGEAVNLPPMNPYERRVIHVHLDDFSDVTTESFGKGSERYVTVLPVAGEPDEEFSGEDLLEDKEQDAIEEELA